MGTYVVAEWSRADPLTLHALKDLKVNELNQYEIIVRTNEVYTPDQAGIVRWENI